MTEVTIGVLFAVIGILNFMLHYIAQKKIEALQQAMLELLDHYHKYILRKP